MNIEFQIDKDGQEPKITIRAPEMTEEINELITLISNYQHKDQVVCFDEDQLIILKKEEIYLIRVEQGKVMIYDQKRRLHSKKRLFVLGQELGSGFMQISKSTYVNLNHLESMENSGQGLMKLKLKNGCEDYISRKYLNHLKKYLGI